jgi:hypothetical protein
LQNPFNPEEDSFDKKWVWLAQALQNWDEQQAEEEIKEVINEFNQPPTIEVQGIENNTISWDGSSDLSFSFSVTDDQYNDWGITVGASINGTDVTDYLQDAWNGNYTFNISATDLATIMWDANNATLTITADDGYETSQVQLTIEKQEVLTIQSVEVENYNWNIIKVDECTYNSDNNTITVKARLEGDNDSTITLKATLSNWAEFHGTVTIPGSDLNWRNCFDENNTCEAGPYEVNLCDESGNTCVNANFILKYYW